MVFECANVLFDTWVHPLMMGLEEHLLGMFREDFEFNDSAAPSHLGRSGGKDKKPQPAPRQPQPAADVGWTAEAEKELGKIPFFVRGKARRNTELYARQNGVQEITTEILYDAKAYFSR